jgi:hypothetical protein
MNWVWDFQNQKTQGLNFILFFTNFNFVGKSLGSNP